jgi:GTP-dependent phosphoenolpyruvate carboxykinase
VALQRRDKYIVHFPETREIWSYGSGYGGNALLGKKCYALRIASVMARDEGWLAEHMLILKLTSPEGRPEVRRGRVPVGLRQDQPGHAGAHAPGLEGRDHRRRHRWMRFGDDGRLYAINPEAGFFGVAPGTSEDQQERHGARCAKNTIFTNVALTDDGDVWWEGLSDTPPANLTDWRGRGRQRLGRRRPTQRALRRRRGAVPVHRAEWEDPKGVPISAILFGGRRATAVPLVTEAFDWEHGVFIGSIVASEGTAAAENARSASCAAIRSPCCPSAATTWATTSPTGCGWEQGRRRQAAAHLFRQLVPQGRERQVPVAGLRREQPRAEVDQRFGERLPQALWNQLAALNARLEAREARAAGSRVSEDA